MKTQTTTTAIVVWNPKTEAEVKALISRGATVPKATRAIAPKGFLKTLQLERRAELMGNSANILGQLADKGFKLAKLSEAKTLASGETVVNAQFRTPAAARALTDAEILAAFPEAKGMTVADLRAAISMLGSK